MARDRRGAAEESGTAPRQSAEVPESTEPTAPTAKIPPTAPGTTAPGPAARPQDHKIGRTRLSGTWAAIVGFAIVLLLLLIFIIQNGQSVKISYLGANGSLPLGVALLCAAVAGILLVALAGSARILQLRATARRHRHADAKAAKAQR